jgi:3-mercaptopyruvate sulfurtransferase SseA
MNAVLSFNARAGPPANNGVLIDAATLQDWMEKGQFQGTESCGKVVLLDVTDADSYADGHIPGAQLWETKFQVQERLEGPAPAVNMVLDGESMDKLLQLHGIDKNTTVIITSSQGHTFYPARAYFLFRYWGWPKNRIKVLDGFNGAWLQLFDNDREAAFTSTHSVCPETDYSVKDRKRVRVEERASLSEAIQMVLDGTGTMVDMRGDKTAAGSTKGVFGPESDFVVFEGRPVGGKSFDWKNFNIDYAGGDLRFKSAEVIAQELIAEGIDDSQPILSYCRTGYIASVGYLVLDAILDWEVMAYDGSWSQWGKMSDNEEKGGELPAGSLWATDALIPDSDPPEHSYMEVLNYNADAGLTVESLFLDADAHAACPSPFDACANNIEAEDVEYVSQH